MYCWVSGSSGFSNCEHGNENERGQMSPRQKKKGENTPKNVGKKSVNDAGPRQGQATNLNISPILS